jgi:vacuolar-type H+-ATPase subunit I/STV1
LLLPVADHIRLLLIAQLVIQVILIAFVVFLLVLEKRRRVRPEALDELKAVVKQTKDLSDTFHGNVQQRVDLLTKVMSDLDSKIKNAEVLIKALEETSVKVKKARQFNSSDVQKLHRGGFEALEISQITGVPVGEIQLMIKVGNPQG